MGGLVTRRAAEVAVLMLDTRVNGKYLPRTMYRRAGVPDHERAHKVALSMSRAASQTITGNEIRDGAKALCSSIPTQQLREMASREEEN